MYCKTDSDFHPINTNELIENKSNEEVDFVGYCHIEEGDTVE